MHAVPDLTSLAAAVGLLSGQPLPRGRRVVVLTNVGGGGVLTADACTAEGLRVEPLPEELQAALRSVLPPLASTGNPVDTGAAAGEGQFAGPEVPATEGRPRSSRSCRTTLPLRLSGGKVLL